MKEETESLGRAARPWNLVAGRKTELLLALVAVASSLAVYAPYLTDISAVYRVWDGPNYLTIARTAYDVRDDNPILAYVHEKSYFLVHLPLYPALIRLLSFLGYQRSMLLVSIASSVVVVLVFFRLARDVWKLPSPGWLSVVLLFLPPRWLLYRSVGSTEATFMMLAILAIASFEKGRTGRASALAAAATLTRISGLMILPAFGVLLLQRKKWRELGWLALIPAPLVLYFGFCWLKTGNFLEYFSRHAAKISPPQPFGFFPLLFKVGWYHVVEFYVLLAFVYAVGTARLKGRSEVLFSFCFFQLVFHLFIATEDWSRYWLVMAPFALVVGFADVLSAREVEFIFPVYVLMALVYAWGTIPLNGAPEEMYAHLLWNLGLWKERIPPGVFGF
jgi:hypothetical protein